MVNEHERDLFGRVRECKIESCSGWVGGGGGGGIQKGYWLVPFSADEALRVSELLLSKPVVYREREFRELASVSLFIGFPYG